MTDDSSSTFEYSQDDTKILRVLEDVAARRIAGQEVADESIISAHADLMPELGERLRTLSAAERARQIAADSTTISRQSRWGGEALYSPELQMPAVDSFRGYKIRREIGRGAMGVVYQALQTATKREVAIKVMAEGPFAGPHDRARFEREAQILGQLKHPNIVRIYDTGVAADRFYIVMDYIEGQPLDVHMGGGERSLPQKLELFASICDAVSAAHLCGVIHRDLKPSNIRIDATSRPHVLDFGLATTAPGNGDGERASHAMTMTGQFVGSLPWASPEQAEGDPRKIDVRTDVYALGVILYQMLTGRFPYPVVGNIRDVIDHILLTEPAKPSSVSRQIDNDVETIALKCLAKERPRRYQSALELARDVRHYLAGDPIEAKRDSSWYVLGKALRRHKVSVSVAAVFVGLLITFGVTMSVMYGRAQHEADRAQRTLTFLQETLFAASSQRLGASATLLQVLDQAAQRVETEFVDQPEVAAAIRYTIGHAYDTLWHQQEAAIHLRAAQELYEQVYGPDHPDTLRCTVLLGMVYGELRDPQAIPTQQEALAIRRKLYGNEHPLVAESMSELAYALWRTAVPRQWKEADRYYQEAIAMYRRLLGPEHPDLARQLFAYAAMYHVKGEFVKAEPLYRESLAMSRKLLGEEHQFVAECKRDFSVVLQVLEKYDEAESMLREVLALTSERFGKVYMPGMLRRMAMLQKARGNLSAARRWFDDSIALTCAQLAESSPDDAERMNRLEASFTRDTAAGVGKPPYREALLAILERTNKPVETAEVFLDLGLLFMAGDSPEANTEAEPLFREALRILDDLPQKDQVYIGYASSLLGHCLAGQQRYQDAESLLLNAYSILHTEMGDEHRMTTDVLKYVVELYDKWNKPRQADKYRMSNAE